MEDNKTQVTPDNGGTKETETKTEPDFSPEQLLHIQKLIQSETDRVRTDYSKKLKDAEKVIKSKMTEDEIKAQELAEKERVIAEKEAMYLKKELELTAVDGLNKVGLPISFKDFLLGADAEATTKNIAMFDKVFKAELDKAVNERLKGKTPGGSGTPLETAADFVNLIKQNQRKR